MKFLESQEAREKKKNDPDVRSSTVKSLVFPARDMNFMTHESIKGREKLISAKLQEAPKGLVMFFQDFVPFIRVPMNAHHTRPQLYLCASRNGERRYFRVNVACRLKYVCRLN